MADRNPPQRSSRSKKARLGKKSRSRRGFKRKIEENENSDNVKKPRCEKNNVNINDHIDFQLRPSSSPTSITAATSSTTTPTNVPSTLQTPTNASALKNSPSSLKYRKISNRSSEKLKNSLFQRKYIGRTRSQTRRLGIRGLHKKSKASCFKVMDAELLSSSVQSAAICGHCKNPKSKLNLFEIPEKRAGLCETLQWECNMCHHITKFQTSKKGIKGTMSIPAYDVNIRSVYASQTMGRAGLNKFCNILNVPPPVRPTPFNNIQNKLMDVAKSNAETSMKETGQRLSRYILENDPDQGNAEVSEEDDIIVNAAVTVDGTWQRRGHTSKIGVVIVISVLTGEVLDYEVKSLFCHQCAKQKNKLDETSFQNWYNTHKDFCQVNHQGSSDLMETEGATHIFLRSVEKHSMRYTTFVGDGDSSCFGSVAKACIEQDNKYVVTKEECVGHVQKRLGTRLRDYKKKKRGIKLSDGKAVGGAGNRLTDKIIDKMQNFYGQCIRNNPGDMVSMQNSIWAIFNHMIKDDSKTLDEQHSKCPKGSDSWCKYWVNRTAYNDKNCMPSVFVDELKPKFQDLTKDDLLQRCLQGLTQNQNEALNHILWSKCLKTKFVGRKRVLLAVCDTICYFNTGSAHKTSLLESFGLSVGMNSLAGFRKEDEERIKNAERKVSLQTRKARRKKRGERKSKGEKTKTTYHPGAFGLSIEPEIDIDGVGKKRKLIPPKSKKKTVVAKNLALEKQLESPTAFEIVEDSDISSLVFVSDETVTFIKSYKAK